MQCAASSFSGNLETNVIAYYLLSHRPDSIDRARAVLDAMGPGPDAVVVSPHPAPLGWATAWERLETPEAADWAGWLSEHEPSAVVVEGTSEHVRAATGSGRQVAVVALPGGGTDGELGPAYGEADLILAPWPAGAADATWPAAWRERTIHLGAAGWAAPNALRSRPATGGSGRWPRGPWRCVSLSATAAGPEPRERRSLVLETPGWQWWFAGEREVLHEGPVWDWLQRADVVLCAPTPTNLTALAAVRVPAVLLLPTRPTASESFLADLAARTAPVVLAQSPGVTGLRFLLSRARLLDGSGWESWDPTNALEGLGALLAGTGARGSAGRTNLAPA
ncbi:MAG: hypothetical protein JWP74_486 [Marmoricola sp.]|nr:hypothetical protein [Marmoricola sp.]